MNNNENFVKNDIKISIIMAYYNRKDQIIQSLEQINNLYYNKYNFEVIIINDSSNNENNLNNIIYNYRFIIRLINLKNKNWINPVIPNNIGFFFASGDIIILQNPEIFHCNDIIKYCIENLKDDDSYFTFPVFSSPDFECNEIINNLFLNKEKDYLNNFVKNINYKDYGFDYNYYISNNKDLIKLSYEESYNHWINNGIKEGRYCNKKKIFYDNETINKWKGWYNHCIYNKRDLNFLSAFNKNLLKKIGGFCNDFKDGFWYDDDDFKNRISKIANIYTIDSNIYFGIHLYHLNGSKEHILNDNIVKLINKNKEIYEKNNLENIIYCKNDTCFNISFEILNNFINY